MTPQATCRRSVTTRLVAAANSFEPDRDIENAEALTSVFGEWPSFHDAEILELVLRRGPPVPCLECLIHVFESTGEVDDRGYHVLKNHVLVRLRFSDIRLHDLTDFNHQNVMYELVISSGSKAERLSVTISTSFGCEAHFDCNAMAVVSVEPFIGHPG